MFAVVFRQLEHSKPPAQLVDPTIVIKDEAASERPEDTFQVIRKKNVFYVTGDRVERIVGVTNMKEPESLSHMFHVLRAMGVIDELLQQGAAQGSEVIVNGIVFSFGGQHM